MNQSKLNPRAFSYVRFSTTKQIVGTSEARQAEKFLEWLEKHPDYTAGSLTFEDLGKSGFKDRKKRQGLDSLLAAIQAGKIQSGDVVVVEALDRLSRGEFLDVAHLLGQILKAGIKLAIIEDSLVLTEDSLNTPILYQVVGKMQAAHEFSKRLSSRVSDAHKHKLDSLLKGEKKLIPKTYCHTNKGKLKHPEAEIILRVVKLYMSGLGNKRIIQKIETEYPDQGFDKKPPNITTKWLESEMLIGKYHGMDVRQRLISDEQWVALQTELKARSDKVKGERGERNYQSQYDLTGLVVCSHCGTNCTVTKTPNKKAGGYFYSLCCDRKLKRGKTGCPEATSIPYSVVNWLYTKTYFDFINDYVKAQSEGDKRSDIKKLETEFEVVEHELNELIGLYTKGIKTKTMEAKMLELQGRNNQLETQIVEARSSVVGDQISLEEIVQSWEAVADVDSELRHQILKRAGYQIATTGRVAFSPDREHRIEIVKHSNRWKCYFVVIQGMKQMAATPDDFVYRKHGLFFSDMREPIVVDGDVDFEELAEANGLQRYTRKKP